MGTGVEKGGGGALGIVLLALPPLVAHGVGSLLGQTAWGGVVLRLMGWGLVLIISLGLLVGISKGIVAAVTGFVHTLADQRQLRRLLEDPPRERGQIEDAFAALHTSASRLRYVNWLEDFRSRPTGDWSGGRAPDHDDEASVRLAKLDFEWYERAYREKQSGSVIGQPCISRRP